MATAEDIAAEWVGFADATEDDRVAGMRTRLTALAAEPEAARVPTLTAILNAELALDNARLGTLTTGRFRAWVGMEAAAVAAISAAIKDARAQMTGQQAMRSTAADQTAAAGLTAEEVATLSTLAPSFRDALPAEIRESIETAARRADEAEPGELPARPERKTPFWKFWQR